MMMEPKIRFFKTEHWNCFPFSEIAVRKSASAISEDQPYVEYEDIISGEGTLNKDIGTKTGSKRGILFTKGDVLFGKLRPYLKNILYAEFDGVAVGDFWVLHSDKIEPKLLYVLANSNNFMKVANISSGSKMPRADWNLVSSTKFYIPQSKDEQRALATFFTSLDNQISAAEKRLASLKQVKAASLQAMFPQEGETTPKLRFKGCEGEWKKVKLGEVFELRNGYTPSKAVDAFWTNGTIPWFRMEDIRDKGGLLKDAYQKITPEAVKGGGLFEANSILLATTATIGVHAMLIADSLANQRFTNLSIRKSLADKYLPMFVYYAFFGIDEWCLKNTNTGGLLSVDINELCKLPFLTPSLTEQRQIASYFTSLDRQISAQSSKISKLKQIKSACLDQMFV